MTIYFVRHGETMQNQEKRLQGRSDSQLNANGISQAERVKEFFDRQGIYFDRIYSSPLRRAVQTARMIAADSVEIFKDDRLLEMDYGPYEGSSLEHPSPEIAYFFKDFQHHPAPEGMESLAHVVKRMEMFLKERQQDPVQNLLVVTHAIAMKGAFEAMDTDAEGAYWTKYIGNCAVYYSKCVNGWYEPPKEFFVPSYMPGV